MGEALPITGEMRLIGRVVRVGTGAASVSLAAIGLAACGSGLGATPMETIHTFLRASATGDAATACRLLSAQPRVEVVKGISCEQGIELGASVYGSIIR